MKLPRCCLSSLILPVLIASARAQEVEDVTALLEPIRAKYGLPGLAAAASIGGRVVAVGATGVRAFGHPEPVTPGDKWQVASCTKSMTASLAGQLVEDGAIRWDTRVGMALPQLATSLHADYKNVTLEQLLSHRGGAPARPPDRLWAVALAQIGTPQQQRMALVSGLLRGKAEAPAGTRFIYSNQGYAIAGAMLEQVAGMPYEELLQRRLFAPLGVKSAGFGAPGTAHAIDQPRGHNLIKGRPDPVEPGPAADHPPALAPAAGVHLSITDFVRYAAWHAHARALLQPATFTKLHTPTPDPDGTYALGWGVFERGWSGGQMLMHNGTNTHFFAVIWVAPARDAAFVAAANLGGEPGRAGVNDAVSVLAGKLLP